MDTAAQVNAQGNVAIDWVKVRKNACAEVETPADWPDDVKPVNWQGINLLGVSQRSNDLFWDGKRVETTKRLANFERSIAGIGATAAAILAIVDAGRAFGLWP